MQDVGLVHARNFDHKFAKLAFCIIFVSKYGNYKAPSLHVWVTCFLNYEVYCMFKVVNDLYLLNILYFNCSKIYAMMRNKTQHLNVSRNVFVNQNS
jgi:hypothetical protein